MKKIFLTLIFLLPFFLYSQTNQDGFNAGYKAGFCYEKYGCAAPVAPIAPVTITPIGQSEFQSGYNSGFAQGIAQSKNISSNNTGAYSQLKRVEPNRSVEYIQYGIQRLIKEQAERDNKKVENK